MVEATSMFQNLLKIGMLVWGKVDSETSPKRSLRRKLFKICCMNWGKLIQLMHTTMVPVQLNTLKIQAGVQLAMRRVMNDVDLMSLLLQLHDPQSELLLLRSCMGIAKLFFGLRTCQPVLMEEATLFFNKGLCGSIKNIVVYHGPFFGDLQWRFAFLPIRFGGLGLYWAKAVSSYEFVASRAQSWMLEDHILRDTGICGMDDDYVSALACLRDTIPSFDFSVKDIEVHFDMTMRQKVVFECLRAPHAQNFLLAIPIYELDQHMSPVKYRTILKYRLMIPLFPVDVICPVCRKTYLDSFGKHAVHRKELPGFKYRHDRVRDVLFDICRLVEISANKEAPVNI
ncbi:hypothetical protein Tco_1417066 [Tanacetum coccineum]